MTPARASLLAALVALAACGKETSGAAAAAVHAPASVRYDQHVSAAEMPPPAESLVNPLRGSAEAASRGEALFGTMNCDGCHGGGAVGFVGPSLADGRWRYGGSDGALYHSVFYGRPRGMPAYGGMLSDTTIWQLVTYVQSLPVVSQSPTTAWP